MSRQLAVLIAIALTIDSISPSPLLAGDAPNAVDRSTQSPSSKPSTAEITGPGSRWPYFQEIALPDSPPTDAYYDVIVPSSVFEAERTEPGSVDLYLGDLRLIDADGKEVPYALRSPARPADAREVLSARPFNRATSPDASQLSLDLGPSPPEHNEVVVNLPGTDYRRRAVLEGSADGESWQMLTEGQLISFDRNGQRFEDRTLAYPLSRFRYLRLQVYQDPLVDREENVAIGEVIVRHTVTVPGEIVTLPATVGPREPTRGNGGPGSAWILELAPGRVPYDRLSIDFADVDFAREFTLSGAGPPGSNEPFLFITSGEWRRLAGERKPMIVELPEHTAARLRLLVTDHRNPPLTLDRAEFSAAARELVFASAGLRGPLLLYYGNHKAEPPHYDLESNLPAQLDPPPLRLKLGGQQANPDFVPEPKPFSERLPWLIYAVLGTACAVLALVLVNLGRAAIARHDAEVVQATS